MTRIIAGTARGRALAVPGSGTRPTADRVKESLFSMLEHALGGFEDLAVLDLYAGSGALGLEAASRGASRVLLVERSAAAARVIAANIATTGLVQCAVAAASVQAWAQTAARAGHGWDVVLADPPYDTPESEVVSAIASLAGNGALADGCHVVVERAKPRGAAAGFPWPEGFTSLPARTYGDTVVHHAVCYGHTSTT
ncbi:MAG: 16S rRNA (guanine(966)-N(2))-methyltransferase RsmD [Actinomycetales bacterium]|nr:16S rRNA (guanine(966)-N(2))-methyltransferase RsmD [Actinomycetales bacterium]